MKTLFDFQESLNISNITSLSSNQVVKKIFNSLIVTFKRMSRLKKQFKLIYQLIFSVMSGKITEN